MNAIRDVSNCGSGPVLGRLSAIHWSSTFRDELKVLMDDLGGVAGYLESVGMTSKCAGLDDMLDQANTLESLWNVVEIFSINSAGHCYFEMVKWLQVRVVVL